MTRENKYFTFLFSSALLGYVVNIVLMVTASYFNYLVLSAIYCSILYLAVYQERFICNVEARYVQDVKAGLIIYAIFYVSLGICISLFIVRSIVEFINFLIGVF